MTTKTTASLLYGSVISAGLALLPFSTALAADGEIDVKATVVATCEIAESEISLDFGNYNPGEPTDTDQSSFFTFDCTADTTVHVALNASSNNNGAQRRLTDGTNHLNYALYKAHRVAPFSVTARRLVKERQLQLQLVHRKRSMSTVVFLLCNLFQPVTILIL